MTYDITGTGKSVARASYSMYYGQMEPGQLAGQQISIGQVFVRYPWADLNGDTFVQANELNIIANPTKSAAFDPTNPTSYLSPGTIDPNLKNDRTREFVVGLQQELMRNLAVEVNYVWRNYDQFTWTDRLNWDSTNFQAFTLATPSNCGPTASCPPVTYYRADVASAIAVHPHQPAGSEPRLQRRRVRVEQALLGSLGGQRQLRLERRDRLLGFDRRHRGPEQHREPQRRVRTRRRLRAPASTTSSTTPSGCSSRAASTRRRCWEIGIAGSASVTQGYPFPQQIAITNRGNWRGRRRYVPVPARRRPPTRTSSLRISASTRRSTSAGCASSRAWTSST